MNILLLSIAFWLIAPVRGSDSIQVNPVPPNTRPFFLALMKEKRNTDNSTRGGDLLQSFTRVDKNEGQAFDPASGIFTVPVAGIYHLTGRFTIGCYQCRTREYLERPVSFDVTVIKNNSPTSQRFSFPVEYTGKESSNPNTRAHEFNVVLQLRAGDKIGLKYRSMKCGEGKAAQLYEATFSGMQVL